MTTAKRPPIVRERDAHGAPIVRVALDAHGTRWATADASDFDRLPEDIRRASWFTNDSGNGYEYVKAGMSGLSGKLVLVARVILGAGRGEAISFHSNDRCNLRRSNMSLKKDGRAKRNSREEVVRRFDAAAPCSSTREPGPTAKVQAPAH